MNEVFYATAVVAVVSTLAVIVQMNAVHALLYLIVSLLAVALVFFTLGAPFVAALEVIIYAGAIMVLFVFVMMMLNLGSDAIRQEKQWVDPKMWSGPAVLALILVALVIYVIVAGDAGSSAQRVVQPKEVGISLFGTYLLGVELASFLLLAGMAGAYHLGFGRSAPRPFVKQSRRLRRPSSSRPWKKRGAPDMASVPVTHALILAGVLFLTGLLGVLVRRNIIFILLSIEIMLNAAGLAFVVAGYRWGQPDGQVMFLFILAMAAAEVSVGLALVLQVHHHFRTLDVDKVSRMRG